MTKTKTSDTKTNSPNKIKDYNSDEIFPLSEDPLFHPKQSKIYIQIFFAPKPITAKRIAEKTKLPLNTVYHHLRLMHKKNIIDSTRNIIGNLVEESWFVSEKFSKSEKKRRYDNSVFNEKGFDWLYNNPNQLIRNVNFIQASTISYTNQYTDHEKEFRELQKNSDNPALLKVWLLTEEEYKYVITEFTKIRLKLRELDQNRDNDIRDKRQFAKEGEKHLVFVGALPDMEI